jgi:hypothetical protein
MVDYSKYANFASAMENTFALRNFKRNSDYTAILEHVTEYQGFQYLQYIRKTNLNFDSVKEYCDLNDRLGTPVMFQYDTLLTSPTSLRYVFHSHLILSHMKSLSLSSVDIVEVGGGYGGLCIAMHHFAKAYDVKINSYTIIDLTPIIKLQEMYIRNLTPSTNVNFVDANTYGGSVPLTNAFMISNYCFSEISPEFRQNYIQNLLPKVSHGFMAWNFIPVFDFGFKTMVEDEYPNTGGNSNKYVYF